MNKLYSIIVAAAVLLSVNACNQTNKKQNNKTENQEKTIKIFTKMKDLKMNLIQIHLTGRVLHRPIRLSRMSMDRIREMRIIGKFGTGESHLLPIATPSHVS